MNTTDCVFCKIVSGEISTNLIYEDKHTMAFLDYEPVNPGHTLVIPKEHYENIFTAPEETLIYMMRTIKKISHGIKDGLMIENMNLAMNNGSIAGQKVFHAHIHLIPRNEADGLKLWKGGKYEVGQAEKIVEQIKKAL